MPPKLSESSSEMSDHRISAVFRINNETVDEWGHLMNEALRHTRSHPGCHSWPGDEERDRRSSNFSWNEDHQDPSTEPPGFITYELQPHDFEERQRVSRETEFRGRGRKWLDRIVERLRKYWRPRRKDAVAVPAQFKYFTKLPFELRTKIWLETVSPWTLAVSPIQKSTRGYGKPSVLPTQSCIDWSMYYGPRTRNQQPHKCKVYRIRWCGDIKLYQICRESRQIASDWYGAPLSHLSIPFSPIQDKVSVHEKVFGGPHPPEWDKDPRFPHESARDGAGTPANTYDHAIPNHLLRMAHRVTVDFGSFEPVDMLEAAPFDYLLATNIYHDRERLKHFARYIRNTFRGVRALTFSFLLMDDCAMRPMKHYQIDNNNINLKTYLSYDATRHHIYYAPRVAQLDAFAQLSNRNKRRAGHVDRVPFPKLRTLQLAWQPLYDESIDSLELGCGLLWVDRLIDMSRWDIAKFVDAGGNFYPGWIMVNNDTTPTLASVLPIVRGLQYNSSLRSINEEYGIDSNSLVEEQEQIGDDEMEEIDHEQSDEGVQGRGVLDDPNKCLKAM